ncbi:MAG: hypothetical protein ACTSRP_13260 [Candidatus Helarchaeota archaeon]
MPKAFIEKPLPSTRFSAMIPFSYKFCGLANPKNNIVAKRTIQPEKKMIQTVYLFRICAA